MMAERALREFFRSIERKYGVTEEQYRVVYRGQGGRCYICRKAKGNARMLGVDHNHVTGLFRGLLCTGSRDPKTCNRLVDWLPLEAYKRLVEYKTDPPAPRILAEHYARGAVDLGTDDG